ncbi:MAG: alpha/beta hydrolase-fold protein [Bacteroidota bacterium]
MSIKAFKNIGLFLLLVLITFGCNQESNEVEVTFKVMVKRQLAEGESAFLAGNQKQLGNWVPDAVELEVKDIYLEKTISFPKNTDIRFKVTKGTWETEAVNADGTVPGDYAISPSGDTVVEVTVQNWKDVIHKIEGQVTGEVRFHRNMDWKNLKNRDVFVWLPPNYETETDRRYPVIYAHDGQNLIDPRTSYKGFDWQLDETADMLIREGNIEPFIIVGINNTSDRSNEYGASELSQVYMEFIVRKLKPMIDEIYRTKTEPEHTTTLGSSMGGLISFMLGWEHNNVFGNAACFSPAFKYQDFNYIPKVTQYEGKKKQLNLYIDNGTEELEKVLQPGCDEMMAALNDMGYQFEWHLAKGAEHDEAAWAKRAWRPMKQFFGFEK